MNNDYIVTIYVVIDDLPKAMKDDVRTQSSAAEILTVAIVVANLALTVANLSKVNLTTYYSQAHNFPVNRATTGANASN